MQNKSGCKGSLKENKIGCHPELDSGSHLAVHLESGEIPYQVRNDNMTRDGFTLIELLVVVLIIGILAAVALPQYNVAVEKARAARLLPLMRTVFEAQNVYFMANGSYSPDLTALDVDLPAGGSFSTDKSEVSYSDFSLRWCAGCNEGSLQGHPNSAVSYYLEFYANGVKYCWATSSSNVAKKVCQSVSGKKEPTMGSTVLGYIFD